MEAMVVCSSFGVEDGRFSHVCVHTTRNYKVKRGHLWDALTILQRYAFTTTLREVFPSSRRHNQVRTGR